MSRYAVKNYNRDRGSESTVEVDAESAFDALCKGSPFIPPTGEIRTTSAARPDHWSHVARPDMAAADNRHYQRNPARGTVGAVAWRIG